MSDESSLGLSHPGPQRTRSISDLPDEILNSIIKELGGTYNLRLYISVDLDHGSWHSCALVCRRWHAITLPHLLRCIRIPTGCSEISYDAYEIVPKFLHFLEENPALASLIQCLIFKYPDYPVDIDDLHRIVSHLPRLYYLEFSLADIMIYNGIYAEHEPSRGERSLGTLVYYTYSQQIEGCNPANILTAIVAPFSTIDRINLNGAVFGNKEDVVVFPIQRREQELQVHELETVGLEFDPRTPQYLRDIGLLTHLRCLIVTLHFPPESAEDSKSEMVGQLIHMSSKTVRELHINLDVYSCELQEYADGISDPILEPLRRGLEACTLVHGFHLRLSESFPQSIRRDPSYRSCLSQSWSLGLEIVSWIANDTIVHLSYLFEAGWESYNVGLLSACDWSRLREISGRFAYARSIMIDVRVKRPWPYSGVESQKATANYICSELSNLGDVLQACNSTGDGRCSDVACVWGKMWPGADNSKVLGTECRIASIVENAAP